MTTKSQTLVPVAFVRSSFGGCASVQYSAMEKVGVYKRDILVDRVEDAQQAQQAAKQEVASAYEQFTALVKVDGGDLEKTYKKLKHTVEDTEDSVAGGRRAHCGDRTRRRGPLRGVGRRTRAILQSHTCADQASRSCAHTKIRYSRMLASMKSARSRIDPVLHVFQDHVLFLKHNPNARALASLKSEAGSIEDKVGRLIEEMEAAIAKADRFISAME